MCLCRMRCSNKYWSLIAEFFQWIRGLCEMHRKAGIFKIYAGVNPIVFLCTPEAAAPLLASNTNLKKSMNYRKLHSWLGPDGLLTSFGQTWKFHRKLVTPAFHFRVLENFLPIINEQADRLVEKLQEYAGGQAITLHHILSKCALNVICETAMGLKLHERGVSAIADEYEKDVELVLKLYMKRIMQPWMWADFVYAATTSGRQYAKLVKRLHSFTKKVILNRQSGFAAGRRKLDDDAFHEAETNEKRLAFLDLLSNHYRKEMITIEDVRQEVDTFMFAGHDTVTQSLTWTLFVLGIYPDVQSKVHEELDLIFAHDMTRGITRADIADLSYLDRVIKETMRVFPTAPWFGRALTEEIEIGNYQIPKGTTCFVFTYGLHRDPDHYRDPETFDPDRFLPENCSGRHPFAFVPFSAGPRNCVGQKFALMELKVTLAKLLRRYQVKSCHQRDDLLLMADMLLRTRNPIKFQLTERLAPQ
ncbi:cytochrome P450 4V2 [Ixodes scapularis]|uniref:cytochrome P450 4V2 n=1 Tax=Ixodes scapularis TaxID=6945 RepID=UPI001C38BF13|nr:cytochrome P450 4V2 [Ixodes scapularis]